MSLFIHYYLLQVLRKHTVPKNKENIIYYSENDSNIAKKYKYTFLNFPFNGSCSCNDEKKPTDNKNFILTSFFLTVKLKCDHTDQLFWKTVQDNMQHESIDSSTKTLQHHNLQLTCKQPRVILFLFLFFIPFSLRCLGSLFRLGCSPEWPLIQSMEGIISACFFSSSGSKGHKAADRRCQTSA